MLCPQAKQQNDRSRWLAEMPHCCIIEVYEMMALEEIGEKQSVNHTPTIALTVAAVLLLIVGALSYRDYVRDSLEKEYAEKEAMMMARHGYGFQPQQQGNVPLQNNFQQMQTNQQMLVQSVPQNHVNPNLDNAMLARQAAEMGIEKSLPQPADPDITTFQDSLEQAREQAQRTEMQYNELVSDVDARASEAAAAAGPPVTSELPEFLREATANPPGVNPPGRASREAMRNKVRSAPMLAQVTGYDRDWGIVTFNAGASQGVKKDQRFAVRRGDIILGWVKVDEVQENTSVAILVTKNRNIDMAEKPAAGDDLIDFELF